MFDLESAIARWRDRMLIAGVQSPVPLEELENHLREEINHLLAAGKTGEESFCIAAARVGRPGIVVAEFYKAKTGLPRPIMIGSLIWILVAMLFLAVLVSRYANGKLSLLLVVHIFTVTAGYSTAFLAGTLGIYHILVQRNQAAGITNLTRTISLATQLSAAFVVVGLLTSMVWSSQNLGRFWTNDPREIGGLCVAIWLMAASLMQYPRRLNFRRITQLGLIGNMLVALAWFGANALHHGYGIAVYGPLGAFLGIHLFILGMSTAQNLNVMDA